MVLYYSQAFTPSAQQTHEIVLDTPYVIDQTKDLLVGWSATHGAGVYPCALDAVTSTHQPLNWLMLDNVWQTMDLDGDWIVHVFIDGKCFSADDCTAEQPYCVSDECVECASAADCAEEESCEDGQCLFLTDTDADGVVDVDDNCPDVCNPQQLDGDSDGIGDLCDSTPGCDGCGTPECETDGQCDSDQDGIFDAQDNCPDTCNDQQLDADDDGIGDVCDGTPGCGGCGAPECEEVCTP
jgi:hypothetical protein